jgi:hypothetical protein
VGDAGGRATRRAIAALVLTVLAATSLHAGRGLRPVRLRLEGYFGAALEGRPGDPTLTVRVGERDRLFQVTKGRRPSGRGFAADVFAQVRMYTPNFIFRANKKRIAEIAAVADGTPVVFDGQWLSGSVDFVVDAFEHPSAPE